MCPEKFVAIAPGTVVDSAVCELAFTLAAFQAYCRGLLLHLLPEFFIRNRVPDSPVIFGEHTLHRKRLSAHKSEGGRGWGECGTGYGAFELLSSLGSSQRCILGELRCWNKHVGCWGEKQHSVEATACAIPVHVVTVRSLRVIFQSLETGGLLGRGGVAWSPGR